MQEYYFKLLDKEKITIYSIVQKSTNQTYFIQNALSEKISKKK